MSDPRERILAALRRLPDNPEFITVQALHREAISIVERDLPESQWQPIETAPRDGTEVYGWKNGYPPVRIHFSGQDWWTHWERIQPTHWMPLPEPPEVE